MSFLIEQYINALSMISYLSMPFPQCTTLLLSHYSLYLNVIFLDRTLPLFSLADLSLRSLVLILTEVFYTYLYIFCNLLIILQLSLIAGRQHESSHPWQGHVGEPWWARRVRARGPPPDPDLPESLPQNQNLSVLLFYDFHQLLWH